MYSEYSPRSDKIPLANADNAGDAWYSGTSTPFCVFQPVDYPQVAHVAPGDFDKLSSRVAHRMNFQPTYLPPKPASMPAPKPFRTRLEACIAHRFSTSLGPGNRWLPPSSPRNGGRSWLQGLLRFVPASRRPCVISRLSNDVQSRKCSEAEGADRSGPPQASASLAFQAPGPNATNSPRTTASGGARFPPLKA